jgi:hypothetical protein
MVDEKRYSHRGTEDLTTCSPILLHGRAEHDLSAEDARQMTENVAGFFMQLAAWDGQPQEYTEPGKIEQQHVRVPFDAPR